MDIDAKTFFLVLFDIYIYVYLKIVKYDVPTAILVLASDAVLLNFLVRAYIFGKWYVVLFIFQFIIMTLLKVQYYAKTVQGGL